MAATKKASKLVATLGDDALFLARAKRQATTATSPSTAAATAYVTDGCQVVLSRVPLTKKGLLMQPFTFQVPPMDDVTITNSHSHTEYDTIGGEQHSRKASRALRTVSIGSMLVDYEATWAVYHRGAGLGPRDMLAVVDQVTNVLRSGTPFQLQIGEPEVWGRWNVDMLATLRQFDVTERPGEPDARYFQAAFTEYRQIDPLTRDLTGDRLQRPDLPTTVRVYEDGTWTTTHKLMSGKRSTVAPTLQNFAYLAYGSSAKWRVIAKANGFAWPGSRTLADLAVQRTKQRKVSGHGGHVTIKVPIIGVGAGSGGANTAEGSGRIPT